MTQDLASQPAGSQPVGSQPVGEPECSRWGGGPGPATVAEELVATLAAYGVERIFMNPGTDTAPLQEALLVLAERGAAVPEVVLCTHEIVALAAAHGYWKMTRRPQCVMVHVDVGTQNLGAMLHDAFRDRAGVVVIAGKAPYSTDPTVPGGRDRAIHWQQDVPDQIGTVRGYTKWAVELARAELTERTIGRALQVAASNPPGPTYVMVARDVLMERPPAHQESPGRRYRPPAPAGLAPESLAELARRLSVARRPLVVTSAVGRDPEAARRLTALSELAGLVVTGASEAVSLAWDHPQWARGEAAGEALVAAADLVMVLECDVPWIPSRTRPDPTAFVVQVDPDPVRADMPLWSFPVDLALQADSAVALGQVLDVLAKHCREDPLLTGAWRARATWHHAVVEPMPTRVAQVLDGREAPGMVDVVTALNSLLAPEDVVIDESVTNAGPVHEGLERTLPGSFVSAGGPGLGWALGGAIGVKLARPSSRVVALVGDGSFLFAVPSSALLVSAQAQAPFLAVVFNNRGYVAAERPVLSLFPDGVTARRGRAVATYFEPTVDFAALSRACGGHGATVRARSELQGVLETALGALDRGQAAVVEVVLGER